LAQLEDILKAVDVKAASEELSILDDTSAFELGYPYKSIGGIQKRG